MFAVPAYQAGASLPGSLATGKAGRGGPDIAMSATNYFTQVDTFEGAFGFLDPFLHANAGAVLHDEVVRE
jgi:hypothetical protein